MRNVRVTKIFDFEAAHALWNYDGKCKNVHGHTYILEVCVVGTPIHDDLHVKNGMVVDFGDLKKWVKDHIVEVYDHSLMIYENSVEEYKSLADAHHKLHLLPYQPTCENMVIAFAEILNNVLPKEIALHHIKLYETRNSFAEWYASDQ